MALKSVDGLGPVSQLALVRHFGSAGEVLTAVAERLRECGVGEGLIQGISAARDLTPQRKILERLQCVGAAALAFDDPLYPPLLSETAGFPLILYTLGDPQILSHPRLLAVVGTRKMSDYGGRAAEKIVRPLCQAGVPVVSGLAFGVDALSHEICLSAGVPTIAVLATGVEQASPRSHQRLFKRIVSHGCVISELPYLSGEFERFLFPRRNRLISGLSQGVLVVEGDLKSGALITARYALEQNRDVYAVPGDIFRETSSGCLYLIREGAKPVGCAEDILSDLGMAHDNTVMPAVSSRVATDALKTPLERRIYEMCRAEALLPDEILMQLAEPAPVVLAVLAKMELKGSLTEVAGRRYVSVQ